MSHNQRTTVLLSLITLLMTVDVANAFMMFGTTGGTSSVNPNTLVRIDPNSGQQTIVGTAGSVPGSRSLDSDPVTGVLLGTDFFDDPGVISQIDPGSGTSTPRATIRKSGVPVGLSALSFAPDQTLYAFEQINTFTPTTLGVVDLDSESFAPTSFQLPSGNFVLGMDFDANGVLYAVTSNLNPSALVQRLLSIDLESLSILDDVQIGIINVDDIDVAPDGLIYHTNFSFGLFRIDPATGAQPFVGFGSVGAMGGIASVVPEPASLTIAGCMIMGATLICRRQVLRLKN